MASSIPFASESHDSGPAKAVTLGIRATPSTADELAVFLASHESSGLKGCLISAKWDAGRPLTLRLKDGASDLFAMHRFVEGCAESAGA